MAGGSFNPSGPAWAANFNKGPAWAKTGEPGFNPSGPAWAKPGAAGLAAPSLDNNQAAYKDFLSSLSNIGKSIPVQPYWIFKIDNFPGTGVISGKYKVDENIKYESYYDQLKGRGGCIFAQGINIPGENSSTSREKLENSGFLGGMVGTGRDGPPELEVTYLETNYSFTDFIMRPWVLAISRAGLKDDDLKMTATCYQLARTPGGMQTRSKFTFNKMCPTSIDSQQYDYAKDTIIHRTVKFAYNTYKMEPGNLSAPAPTSTSAAKPTAKPTNNLTTTFMNINLPNGGKIWTPSNAEILASQAALDKALENQTKNWTNQSTNIKASQ